MFHRIDPSLPVVRTGADEVRIGLDPTRVVLRDIDGTVARGLGELVRGTSDSRLTAVMRDAHRAHELIDQVRDVLRVDVLPDPPRVGVVGRAGPTDAIGRVLGGATKSIVSARTSAELDAAVDLVVLASDFVVSPIEIQPWLGGDVPHVPVVFGEAAVTVGPLVLPGRTPCVRCVELERCDLDPAWTAIAPQVWGRRSPLAETVLATHAAAAVLWLCGGEGGYSVRIDARTRARVTIPHALHPRCGCVSLLVPLE